MRKHGEIVGASQDEADMEFYKQNPDYNPNPLAPRSTDISDYSGYSVENETLEQNVVEEQ